MLYLQARGRLGNQMFYYAYARKLLTLYPHLGELGIYFPSHYDDWGGDQLSAFNTIPFTEITQRDISHMQKMVGISFKLLRKMVTILNSDWYDAVTIKLQPLLNQYGVYEPINECYLSPIDSRFNDVWCSGISENPCYFNDIRKKLMKEFTPRLSLLEHNKRLMETIIESNSVCLSIRKGDFLVPGNEKYDICDDMYYASAIDHMKRHVSNMKLIVFSDDIEFVKHNMHFDVPVIFENNDGKDPTWEKLRLMYSCKHYIISNSTFSWWSQYLSRNDDRIVIAPRPWRVGEYCDYFYDNHTSTLNATSGEPDDLAASGRIV